MYQQQLCLGKSDKKSHSRGPTREKFHSNGNRSDNFWETWLITVPQSPD